MIDTAEDMSPIRIAIRDLHKSFGENQVLRGVSMDVYRGTNSVVMGGSGSGKSVLIKTIVGLMQPDSGGVWIDSKKVDELSEKDLDTLRLDIGYLFQSGALFDSMTVAENLSFILERHAKMTRAERRDRVMEVLEWMKLPEKANDLPAELSGGQKKRVALGRAIVLNPSILMYDEPTTGLDPLSVRTVSELIVRLRDERQITSVIITHDLLCAEIVSDSAHFIHDGVIAESGSLDDLRASAHPIIRTFFQDH